MGKDTLQNCQRLVKLLQGKQLVSFTENVFKAAMCISAFSFHQVTSQQYGN